LAKLDNLPPPPIENLALPPSGSFSSSIQQPSVTPLDAKAEAPLQARAACEVERAVRRTLSDSVRSRPVRELAERLRKDIEQTAAKTVVFVGIGSSSDAHEALVYAATLMAEQTPQKVLVVDANFSNRSLSESLDYARETGLAECIRDTTSAVERCRPTSVDRLSLLPAGQLSPVDMAADTSSLTRVLEQLGQAFDFIFVDGGRTDNAASRTLARLADAAYFVVQLGTVETATAQAALSDFRAAGARVLGCIAT
jgi:Mrp family chromosome partitioning ATPase